VLTVSSCPEIFEAVEEILGRKKREKESRYVEVGCGITGCSLSFTSPSPVDRMDRVLGVVVPSLLD